MNTSSLIQYNVVLSNGPPPKRFYSFALNRGRRQNYKLKAEMLGRWFWDSKDPWEGLCDHGGSPRSHLLAEAGPWQCRGQCGLVSGADRRWVHKNYGLRPGLPGPGGRPPRRGDEAALLQPRWEPREPTKPAFEHLAVEGTRPLSDLLVSCWDGFHFQVGTSFKRSWENKPMMTQILPELRPCLNILLFLLKT